WMVPRFRRALPDARRRSAKRRALAHGARSRRHGARALKSSMPQPGIAIRSVIIETLLHSVRRCQTTKRADPATFPPMPRFLVYFPLLCLLAASTARAQLTIEIIGGGATAIPIAIVPFRGDAGYPVSVSSIVGADLERSGRLRLVDPGGVNPRPSRPE